MFEMLLNLVWTFSFLSLLNAYFYVVYIKIAVLPCKEKKSSTGFEFCSALLVSEKLNVVFLFVIYPGMDGCDSTLEG